MATTLSHEDVPSAAEYEAMRGDFRRKIMVTKRPRRILIGTNCSAHFENRMTMKYQLLEMLRCEGTWDDPKAVADELVTHNPLITQPDALSMTLLLEYPTQQERDKMLPLLVGIERHIWLEIGRLEPILGIVDGGQTDESTVRSVKFVIFPLEEQHHREIEQSGAVLRLRIDHPHYQAEAVLGEETRRSLAEDIAR